MTVTAYIALGSNQNDPNRQLKLAVQRIQLIEKTHLFIASSVYETAPIGLQNQPNFMNQVVGLKTNLSAELLLQSLQAIEREMGRVRTYHWGPRLIDCDLLLYGDEIICTENLVVPHPRMKERAFVLQPLSEIAPTLCLPSGESVPMLLQSCALQSIRLVGVAS